MIRKKFVRVFVFILAVLLSGIFTANPVLAAKQSFTDVPPTAWFFQYVENLYARKIVGGFGTTGKFKPNHSVQRQHAAKMVVKGADIAYKGKKSSFPDVPASNEMSPFIGAMQELGIVKGFPDGTFRPTKTLSRAEAAVFIAKAFQIKPYGQAAKLTDVQSHWAKDEIELLLSNGVVKGYKGGLFKPGQNVTRAELSKMINIAMAVKALQVAQDNYPDPLDMYHAQTLIDSLPQDQDPETREALYERMREIHKGVYRRYFKENEPNNTTQTANAISPVKKNEMSYFTVLGTMTNSIADIDFYKIWLPKDMELEFYAEWYNRSPYPDVIDRLELSLYNKNGQLLAKSTMENDLGKFYFQHLEEALVAGTYYLKVNMAKADASFVNEMYAIYITCSP